VNVQCLLCKEIVAIGDFRSSARGIEITCGACGGSYRVDAPARSASEPREAGEGEGERVCPKCDAVVDAAATACARCGLAADRFDGFEHDQREQVPDALRELWQECAADWDDAAGHDRFVKAAVAAEAYRYAAARYRQVSRERGGDRIADERLGDISRRAEAAILQTAAARRYEEPTKEPYRAVAIMLAVLVALAAVGAVYALVLREQKRDEVTAPAPGKVDAKPHPKRGTH